MLQDEGKIHPKVHRNKYLCPEQDEKYAKNACFASYYHGPTLKRKINNKLKKYVLVDLYYIRY